MPGEKSRILITGINGFIGRSLAKSLLANGFDVTGVGRQESGLLSVATNKMIVGDLSELLTEKSLRAPNELVGTLRCVDVLVHTAARVHVINDDATNPLVEFRRINRDMTLDLARVAAKSGVKRFIFLSTIKVNGEGSWTGQLFTPEDSNVPLDSYGLSKYEAEQGLLTLAEEVDMEVVIIRPPLVYGPGVKANFLSMLKWVNRGIPLPLGRVHNQRSLVALDNLISFIICCIVHPQAANQIFLISDGEDVSTTELLRKIAKAYDKKIILISVPIGLVKFLVSLVGRADIASRLFGSLQIDNSKASRLLGWKPETSMDDELKKTVEAYLNEKAV